MLIDDLSNEFEERRNSLSEVSSKGAPPKLALQRGGMDHSSRWVILHEPESY